MRPLPTPGRATSPLARLLAPLLAALALWLAPGPAWCQQADNGDGIVVGVIGDATSMIPMLTSDAASHEMSGQCFNGLVKYDKDLNLVGDLAESWRVSPDGLTITFKLRQNARFHDGAPYTAKDALFSWRFMTDPNTPTPYSGDYLKVEKAEALDEHTFQVRYKEPFAPGLASWSLTQMPAHLLEGQDPRKSPLNRHPIGTGPYRFKSWTPGSKVELTYFPGYWEGRPHLDSLIYRVIPDMATLFLELRSGGVDWMGLTALQYRRQTDTRFFEQNFRKYRYLASAYNYIGWNLRDKRFQDLRVRQALSHAVNKEEIIEGVLLGLGQECTGPLKPGTLWHNPKVRRYPYDPDKARDLLAQAGWLPGPDGVLVKDGQPFQFVLLTNQGNRYRQNAGVIIQRRLAEVGVKVELRIVEWAAFLREFIDKGRFDAVLLAWTIPQDPDLYDIFASTNIGPGKLNFNAYQNPGLDRLLEQGRRTFDQGQRKAIYDRVQEILAEEVPYTFLYVADALPIVHARFQGIEPAPAGISHNFIRWWVPKALQKPSLAP
ncbi:MAG: peptide-binding protein [Desulfarculus sp.]|nr:peptide-binding protein [Desulfarculus sp.]